MNSELDSLQINKTSTDDLIQSSRLELNSLHLQLSTLLQKRLQLTQTIWQEKLKILKQQGLALENLSADALMHLMTDENRENELVNMFLLSLSDDLQKQFMQQVMSHLILENKKYLIQKIILQKGCL